MGHDLDMTLKFSHLWVEVVAVVRNLTVSVIPSGSHTHKPGRSLVEGTVLVYRLDPSIISQDISPDIQCGTCMPFQLTYCIFSSSPVGPLGRVQLICCLD